MGKKFIGNTERFLILLLIVAFLVLKLTGCSRQSSSSLSEKDVPQIKNPPQSQIIEPPKEKTPENPKKPIIIEPKPKESKTSTDQPAQETNALEALSNEKYGWGLVPTNDGTPPEIPKNWKELLIKYDGYYLGNTSRKEVYLTFDEGYEGGYTSQILDILKENSVKAAFFITGYYLDKNESLVQRMIDEGHIVGNHSVNHPSFPTLSLNEMKSEIKGLADKYSKIIGENMKYFRPPMGEFSERSLALTKSLGYKTIFWSIAMKDWEPLPGGAEESYNTVISRLHNGAIILLHAVSKDDTIALPRIIKTIKDKGYEFKTLDELP